MNGRKLTAFFAMLTTLTMLAVPVSARQDPTPTQVIERALDAHGGEVFRDPQTLQLSGTAIFYNAKSGKVRSHSDDYRMWREFQRGRKVAHGADGKVRIVAKSDGHVLFEVGYDGDATWTQDGVMPQELADAYWANNFGFGIIRSALDDGFSLKLAPARNIDGHDVTLVRVTDAVGQETLFGIDQESGFIRYMAFDSPRGFHERVYDEFIRIPASGWVQATSVTLLYDGVVSNSVKWNSVEIGMPIASSVFTPPSEGM